MNPRWRERESVCGWVEGWRIKCTGAPLRGTQLSQVSLCQACPFPHPCLSHPVCAAGFGWAAEAKMVLTIHKEVHGKEREVRVCWTHLVHLLAAAYKPWPGASRGNNHSTTTGDSRAPPGSPNQKSCGAGPIGFHFSQALLSCTLSSVWLRPHLENSLTACSSRLLWTNKTKSEMSQCLIGTQS